MSVQELYDQTIKHWPAAERLLLATTILNDIPPQSVVDYGEEWSEEDQRDFSKASLELAVARLEEEENA